MTYPNNANTYLAGTITTPSTLLITGISQSNPMSVTTTFDPVTAVNTYIAGMLVKLIVPKSYGMYQANGLIGKVMDVMGPVFLLSIDATSFDAFITPPSMAERPASLTPYGINNVEYNNTNLTNLPFKSLNNRGN